MPNTPALIGRGIAGMYAREAVTEADRAQVEAVLAPTGTTLWVAQEADLDAVTALSGSGPAYVFYFIEAMMQAGAEMGLEPSPARRNWPRVRTSRRRYCASASPPRAARPPRRWPCWARRT